MIRNLWRNLRQQGEIDLLRLMSMRQMHNIDSLMELSERYLGNCKSLQLQKNNLIEKLARSEKQSDRRLESCFKYQREIRELNKQI